MHRKHFSGLVVPAGFMLLVLGATAGRSSEWAQWRGVLGNGQSSETGLVSSWAKEGDNLIWRQDYTSRATPIVLGGKVFVSGRAGEGRLQREIVTAFDADSGAKLWEHVIPTHLTTVPFNRAGWAGLAGDTETGYVYFQGIGGPFYCFDQDGNIVWQHSMYEEFGRFSGYGGRTHTPLVDEDRVIVSVINSSWGSLGAPRHRYFAFDKKTGAVLWIATPGGETYDLNTQGSGTIAVLGGRRLFITGNADGSAYALEARTGRTVWNFSYSKGALNSTPMVAGDAVILGHSEENLDQATMGRVVALDGTKTGTLSAQDELWRRDISMGFPTPAYDGKTVYVMDNSANFYALDPATGVNRWELGLGTVGKAAAVIADGKIYVTEVNGRFKILRPKGNSVETLDDDELNMPDGRYAEIYASPAIANGRIYLATEEGLYCIGDKRRGPSTSPSPQQRMAAEDPPGPRALIQIVPAEVTRSAGSEVSFEIRSYDAGGRYLGAVDGEWSGPVQGEWLGPGRLRLAAGVAQAGEITAKAGGLEARARVRAFPDLPYAEKFDDIQGPKRPYWIGAGRFAISDDPQGGKRLEKPSAASGLQRSILLLGPDWLHDYTVEADVMGGQAGRRLTDVGVVNAGYILDLMGNQQKLQIRSWQAMLRMAETVPFTWEMNKWYRMKLRVQRRGDTNLVQGKVWVRGEPEPNEWTVSAEDPLPIENGSPGIIGYSPASLFVDNVTISENP